MAGPGPVAAVAKAPAAPPPPPRETDPAFAKATNPTQGAPPPGEAPPKESGFSWSDFGHMALDVVGMVPGVGEVADLANAGWYAAEGDYGNAALSAASAIPFAGNLATGAKWAKRGVEAADALNDASKAVKTAEKVEDGVKLAERTQDGARTAEAAADAGRLPASAPAREPALAGAPARAETAPAAAKAPGAGAPAREPATAGAPARADANTGGANPAPGDGGAPPPGGGGTPPARGGTGGGGGAGGPPSNGGGGPGGVGSGGGGTPFGPHMQSNTHLKGPDGFKSNGRIHGTHSKDEAVALLGTRNSTHELKPTGTPGIEKLEYVAEKPNGNIVYGEKTVYDPAHFAAKDADGAVVKSGDDVMFDMAKKAGDQGWQEFRATGEMKPQVTQDGVNFQVYINQSGGAHHVGNVHPIE